MDQRLINPMLPDDPKSKVNTCINNLFRIWEEGKEQKTTQLVFCDLSTPKGSASQPSQIAAKAAPEEINGFSPPQTSEGQTETPQDLERFSVYDDTVVTITHFIYLHLLNFALKIIQMQPKLQRI